MPLFSQHRAHPAQAPAPAPSPAGTAAAQLLRRYRPLETRATGGFGSVEICLDARLQRRVAIKRIPLSAPGTAATVSSTTAAIAEARTVSLLQHPNIVSLIDFSFDAAYAYLVMEYVDGMSLEEFLRQVDGSSLTYDELSAVTDALAQALSYAHENGVLHLDIKPANVLIDHSGHIKLADFGMATLTSAAGFGGARGGTLGYMPPEQIRGESVDERADVFSLACVLYESLCAAAPFRAESPAESLLQIEQGVQPPSELLADFPPLAEEALLAALSPDAALRPVSVTDFADRFCAGLGNPREGRRSLARLVAHLTSDEEPDAAETAEAPQRTWELDPAEGHLGSRFPHARRIAAGAVSGAAVAVTSHAILSTMGLASAQALACALAIGGAAALAPQIGSALIATGFLVMIASATPVLSVIPAFTAALALIAGWWLVWGRTLPPASMVLALACALAAAAKEPAALALIPAALAGYFLPVLPAAASTGVGIFLAALIDAALAAGGPLPADRMLAALADPSLWLGLALAAAAAALTSFACSAAWRRYRETQSAMLFGLAGLVPGLAAIAQLCLGNPVEIASHGTGAAMAGAGAGALSSILVWICVFALGYRKDQTEGDRS